MKEAYLDAEWFIGGKVFLIGVYSSGKCHLLHHGTCTRKRLLQVLPPPGAYLYFYGPDIGVLEKHFGIELRHRYRCINLLKVFRQLMPGLKSYKLAYIEKKFSIRRARAEYKKNIFDIYKDWRSHKWLRVLEYNREDVVNLARLKQLVFKKYKVRVSDVDRLC